MEVIPIVDSHVHFSAVSRYEEFIRYLDGLGAERAGIVSLPDRRLVNFNLEAFAAKLAAPERFFVFAGLDYTHWFYPELVRSPSFLGPQVERLAELGADGIKMWAGKPTFQRQIGFGLDDEVYSSVYDAAARHSLPIVIHIADPPEFWGSDRQRFGWEVERSTAPTASHIPSFEHLQAQAEGILARNPHTTFIFPHLMFRTGDLEAFERFMRRYTNAYLDLSPGLYFYGDLHRQSTQARAFFQEFRERILFGSDAMWFEEGHPYLPCLSVENNLAGAQRLLGFLATHTVFENPFALTRDEVTLIEGLELPESTMKPILGGNFYRIVGTGPRGMNDEAIRGYRADIERERREIARMEVSR